jgi:pectate lyase
MRRITRFAGAVVVVWGIAAAACDSDETAGGTGGTAGAGAGTVGGGGTGATTTTSSSSGGGTGGSGGGAAGAYEGFGTITQGHASCPEAFTEVHVTTLDDDGPGSLREALTDGCRLILFDLGGTIVLQDDLNIRYSHITIDGASAPAPGITIEQPGDIGTTIEARASTGPAHDIIIHHLRLDGMATDHTNAGDIWGLDGMDAPVSAVILDHLTGVAATDGVFDIYGDVKDVTLSYNLIIDTAYALHVSTADINQSRERISFHHNVLSGNNERQIRLRHDNQLIDFVNNVIYGWGWWDGYGYGLYVNHDPGETNTSVNVVANVFHNVASTSSDDQLAIRFDHGADEGTVYFEGNIVPSGESDNVSNGAALDIPSFAQVTRFAADTLGQSIVPQVGTHHPTSEEQALLQEIATAIAP